MATNLPFKGCNRQFVNPLKFDQLGTDTGKPDIFGFNNGNMVFSRWRLSHEEIDQILRTGEIWLGVMTGGRPMQQTFVGSKSDIVRTCADFGSLWTAPSTPLEGKPEDDGDDFSCTETE